ncbi:hypothetical protein BBP40_003120 [Aspergillus hancockii]|nr:hypothetical protein BBP40_003120 [Aspergillus hancockii]
MSRALTSQTRPILFQICEWGIDFPALWAPALGHSWRIGNDITPHWRAIFRTLNQAVPQTSLAGPGQWPDLDMLMVGNGVFSIPEEQTHFSLWAILKSPLVIGAALKDEVTSIAGESLGVLKQEDVIGFNQDKLGFAGTVRNIWDGTTASDVGTSYTARVAGHGTVLLELADTVLSGVYPSEVFASSTGSSTVFKSIYGLTTSSAYSITINFSKAVSSATEVQVQSSANNKTVTVKVPASSTQATAQISLEAGSSNAITILSSQASDSINITPPNGTYYPNTVFKTTGNAKTVSCGEGYCQPVGSKIGDISSTGTASAVIPATAGKKYLAIDYINNEVAFDSAWGWGSNSRNLTVSVNGEEPVRLEVPLSGQHSELFGPGLGWWDTATIGLLVDGWKDGDNEVVIGNERGETGFQSYGPDFVGLRVL